MSQYPPVQPNYATPPPSGSGSNGLSITAMILGIVSVVLFCVMYVSVPCAVLAITFGFIGRSKGGGGMATTGIVLGIVSLLLLGLFVGGLLTFLHLGGTSLQNMAKQMQQYQQQMQQQQNTPTTSPGGAMLQHGCDLIRVAVAWVR